MTRKFIFALLVILKVRLHIDTCQLEKKTQIKNYKNDARHSQGIAGRKSNPDLVCRAENGRVTNRNLCVFPDYNKFDLPVQEGVNMIDIGIDITDVLRINDKVSIYLSANLGIGPILYRSEATISPMEVW